MANAKARTVSKADLVAQVAENQNMRKKDVKEVMDAMLDQISASLDQGSKVQLIEPPWKAILSNKGVLPLLWQRHEGHPNLLPAFFDDAFHEVFDALREAGVAPAGRVAMLLALSPARHLHRRPRAGCLPPRRPTAGPGRGGGTRTPQPAAPPR